MSIIVQENYERRGWGGSDNPRYPIGQWVWSAAVDGDLTGGVRQLDVIFSTVLSGKPKSSLMYSLEQFAMGDSDNNTKALVVSQQIDADLNRVSHWWMQLQAGPGTVAALVTSANMSHSGIFLGAQPTSQISALLSFSTTNVNGQVFFGTAQGYIWDGRSRSAIGGPGRPVDGLFSR